MPLGSIIGGIIGSNGAANAGGAAGAAGDQAYQNAKFWSAYINGLESPWTGSGKAAQDEMNQLLGLGHLTGPVDANGDIGVDQTNRATDQANALARFKTSPDYQFRLTQGLNALDRSAASRGMVLSGAQTKGVQQFGGDLASGEYNNYYNKLAGVSGQGKSATDTVAGATTSLMNNGINDEFQGGLTRAKSFSDSANALASGIGKGIQNLGSIVAYNPYNVFGNI